MFIEKIKHYDGSLIHKRFAYEFFRKDVLRTGNIVAFVGSMEVTDNLVDLEDSLSEDFIYSDKAINFCWEIPDIDMFGGIAFQRLFNTQIANILYSFINKPIYMRGDDIMVKDEQEVDGIIRLEGKASVSITTTVNRAVVGHTGININAGKRAPVFAYSTNLNEQQTREFIDKVLKEFYKLTDDIFVSSTKVI